jgi:hypothetical protein
MNFLLMRTFLTRSIQMMTRLMSSAVPTKLAGKLVYFTFLATWTSDW